MSFIFSEEKWDRLLYNLVIQIYFLVNKDFENISKEAYFLKQIGRYLCFFL